MGATCSQPREPRKVDMYAENRIWSTYSLENREQLEESCTPEQKKSAQTWPGVYGFQHEVIKLEKGCFTSAKDSVDDGFLNPGPGIGTQALGLDKNGRYIHGVAKTNNYAEVYTGLSGERVVKKYTHELVWFDEEYDQNNLRRTQDMGKLVRRGDESEEEARMLFADNEEDDETSEPTKLNLSDNEEEDGDHEREDERQAFLANAPPPEPEPPALDIDDEEEERVSEDSAEDAALSEADDTDLKEMLSPEYELRIDSPRSRYRILGAMVEGMDEAQAVALARTLKQREREAELQRKIAVGATLGMTAEEIMDVEQQMKQQKIGELIAQRTRERQKRFQERMEAQRVRRAERMQRRIARDERRRQREEERRRLAEEAEQEKKRQTIGVSTLERGYGGPDGHVIENLDFSDYILGQPLMSRATLDNKAEVDAMLEAAMSNPEDIAGRQQAMLRKQQLKRNTAMKKKMLAAQAAMAAEQERNGGLASTNAYGGVNSAYAEPPAEVVDVPKVDTPKVIIGEKIVNAPEEGGNKPAADDRASNAASAASPSPVSVVAPPPAGAPATGSDPPAPRSVPSLGVGETVVDGDVSLVTIDEIRAWERRMLETPDLSVWSSFAAEKGKYEFYQASAAVLGQAHDKSLKVFLGQMFIPDKSPVQVFHELYDISARKQWDDAYVVNEISKQWPTHKYHNEIWLTRVKLPVMKMREFLLLRGYVLYKDAQLALASHTSDAVDVTSPAFAAAVVDPMEDYRGYLQPGKAARVQAITYAYRSTDYCDIPETKEVVRATSQGSNLFYAVPQPSTATIGGRQVPLPVDNLSNGRPGTMLYLMSSNDPKASMPAWMINSAAIAGFKDWCKTFLKHMAKQ